MIWLKNIYNNLIYGKIIYKSSSGKVIRKRKCLNETYNVAYTTKTIFDKNGNITSKIEREAYIGRGIIRSFVDKIIYSAEGAISILSKNYNINHDTKECTDYSNKFIDYSNAILRDNKNKNIIPQIRIWYRTSKIDKKSGKIESTYNGNPDIIYLTKPKIHNVNNNF